MFHYGVEVISGNSRLFNIWKIINVIYHVYKLKKKNFKLKNIDKIFNKIHIHFWLKNKQTPSKYVEKRKLKKENLKKKKILHVNSHLLLWDSLLFS